MRQIERAKAVILCGSLVFTSGAVCSTVRAQGGEVTYELTFEATWSQATHPQDFPPGPHFSGLIGGTHNSNVSFWQEGGLATNGIENMAEVGSKTPLDSEINNAITAGDAFSVLSGGGISPSPGTVTLTFQISDTHPLVTLVSMLAPSPDWFVGVSGLNLQDGNGNWLDVVTVNLDPYDSGTDNGPTFTSANDDAQPPVPISSISNSFPFAGSPLVGTYTFQRLTPPAVPALSNGGLVLFAALLMAAALFVLRKRSVSSK